MPSSRPLAALALTVALRSAGGAAELLAAAAHAGATRTEAPRPALLSASAAGPAAAGGRSHRPGSLLEGSLLGLHSKCGVVASSKDEGAGAGFSPAMLRSGAQLGLAWHTDWSSEGLAPGFSPSDYSQVKLVPQFWGPNDVDFAEADNPIVPVLLGFNEPDMQDMGGSDMDVDFALDLWMELVGKGRQKGYTMFVAPSIAQALPDRYTGRGDGNEWLPTFLTRCLAIPGCPESITFLGFHMYDPNCPTDRHTVQDWNMDVRVGSLKKLMAEFNDKGMNIRGLWLTEFAGRSDDAPGKCRTREQQLGWMELIVPMLNAEPAVFAYSWFSYGEGHSPFFPDDANLWDYATGQPNELGQAYFRLCTTPPPNDGVRWWVVFISCVASLAVVVALAVGGPFAWRRWGRRCRRGGASGLSSEGSEVGSEVGESPQGNGATPFLAMPGDAAAQQALRAARAKLLDSVSKSGELVRDSRRFKNECEGVFTDLRGGVLYMKRASCQGAEPGSLLAGIDPKDKEQVWDFVLLVAEQRSFLFARAKEVADALDGSPGWQEARRQRADLHERYSKAFGGS